MLDQDEQTCALLNSGAITPERSLYCDVFFNHTFRFFMGNLILRVMIYIMMYTCKCVDWGNMHPTIHSAASMDYECKLPGKCQNQDS